MMFSNPGFPIQGTTAPFVGLSMNTAKIPAAGFAGLAACHKGTLFVSNSARKNAAGQPASGTKKFVCPGPLGGGSACQSTSGPASAGLQYRS